MSRGVVVAILGVAILALALPPAAGAPAQFTTVRVAFRPLQTWGPLFIAEKEGFFARQGIKIEWVQQRGGGEAMVPLLAGQLQVGPEAASAAFFNAAARGEMVRIVADKGYVAPGSHVWSSLVVRKDLAGSAIKTPADLKGRRIALNALGSTAHYTLTRILAKGGLKIEDVDLHRLPTESAVVALRSRAVDAIMVPEPWISHAEEQGFGVLFAASGDYIPNEQVGFLFFGPDFLRRDRALGQRFMVAYVEGLRQYVRGMTPRNLEIVSEYTQLPTETIRKGGWISMFADGHVEVNLLRRFQDWLYEIGMIGVRNPIQNIIDSTFIEYAASQLSPRL
ncbi:MAG: ABC transporter substrate-binding protein [Armatimonadota bacterium]|nr:ABC transporter substrate-binding protein [Armatimonadota bacterium]